jgi:hypothetical protein
MAAWPRLPTVGAVPFSADRADDGGGTPLSLSDSDADADDFRLSSASQLPAHPAPAGDTGPAARADTGAAPAPAKRGWFGKNKKADDKKGDAKAVPPAADAVSESKTTKPVPMAAAGTPQSSLCVLL